MDIYNHIIIIHIIACCPQHWNSMVVSDVDTNVLLIISLQPVLSLAAKPQFLRSRIGALIQQVLTVKKYQEKLPQMYRGLLWFHFPRCSVQPEQSMQPSVLSAKQSILINSYKRFHSSTEPEQIPPLDSMYSHIWEEPRLLTYYK